MAKAAEPTPDEREWALAEAHRESLGLPPGWFRAWPFGEQKWSVVNVKSATQVIVNHSVEHDRHPDAWTVRALFGTTAVELRFGPYDTKRHAMLVAHAVLTVSYAE